MKNTKANVIELLKKMADNEYACSQDFKEDGNERMADICINASIALEDAVKLLTDQDYFEKISNIFMRAEEA